MSAHGSTFETSTDVRYTAATRPLSGVIWTLSGHRPRAEFDSYPNHAPVINGVGAQGAMDPRHFRLHRQHWPRHHLRRITFWKMV
jgi:hypothetical protein